MGRYSTNRIVEPRRPPEQRFVPVAHLSSSISDYTCSDLRIAGVNSDVMVYDAKTMKPLRKETPNGEVIKRF